LALIISDVTDADIEHWKILQWMYNGLIYNSTEEFRLAVNQNEFEKTPINLDGKWTSTEDFESNIKEKHIPPPVMVQTAPRYSLDCTQKFISWSR
jgi:primary-amine oxidase